MTKYSRNVDFIRLAINDYATTRRSVVSLQVVPPAHPRERTFIPGGAAQGTAVADAGSRLRGPRASARSHVASLDMRRCESREAGRACRAGAWADSVRRGRTGASAGRGAARRQLRSHRTVSGAPFRKRTRSWARPAAARPRIHCTTPAATPARRSLGPPVAPSIFTSPTTRPSGSLR